MQDPFNTSFAASPTRRAILARLALGDEYLRGAGKEKPARRVGKKKS